MPGGKSSRRKGYETERKARLLLQSRGWTDVQRRPAGEKGDDLKATDPDGCRWSVEVKGTAIPQPKHWAQCASNAEKACLPPMLMWRVPFALWGVRGLWLVVRNRDGARKAELWYEGHR